MKGHPMEELIQQVKQTLIRKDRKLNSPIINSPKTKWLVDNVKTATLFLPEDACFSRRWWHVQNGSEIPRCKKCNNLIPWNDWEKCYKRYCTQRCAATSVEASERTRQQFKDQVIPQERIDRITQTRMANGYKHSENTKHKLSKTKLGELNPSYGKVPWNKGFVGSQSPNFGKKFPERGMKGVLNPQFGKAPSSRAGKGIWGEFNGYHFRSSLELMYLIFWYENNCCIETAETHMFRVEYITELGATRTYSPDFFLPDTNELVELKPENLQTNKQVLLKLNALANKHSDKRCKLLGYKNIGEFIRNLIYNKRFEEFINKGILEINEEQHGRLIKNYADIIRSTI